MRPPLLAASLACAAMLAGSGLHAQEYDTARRTFTFFGRDLAIEVQADGPGALQVVRGQPGRIEVAARAPDGLSAVGLGGYSGDVLRLTAIGGGNAHFIVVVPERVFVAVTLPGHGAPARVPDQPGAVLHWGGPEQALEELPFDDSIEPLGPAPDAPAAHRDGVPGLVPPDADGLFLVHYTEAAPAEFVLQDAALSRVQVRIEGDRFRVRSSEPLALRNPGGQALRVRTGERPITLVVTVPTATRFFRLRSDQDVLLTIHEQQASTGCERAVAVRTAAGQQHFEFLPLDGRIRCR